MRNQVIDPREILGYLFPGYLVLSKAALDCSSPSFQFNLPDYQNRARREGDKNGGGLIELIKRDLICKRFKNFQI